MAVKVCLQAPKELRSQVEINLSHGEQPPLLKTHLCVLGGTGHEGEWEPAFTNAQRPSPVSMRTSNAVWVNRRAKISSFCFYYNCMISQKSTY